MNLSYINYFLPIILIFSSLKLFGYVLGFLFFLPFIVKKRGKIFEYISKLSLESKLVLYYFYFQIFQTIIGSFTLKDIRILIYWVPFYVVSIYSYYSHSFNYLKDKLYKSNIFLILYYSSFLYFIFYFILNICSYFVFGNAYEIQENFWMGSSAAFSISSIFLLSIFNLWRKENFKLNSKYNYSFLFFILISNINDSRLAALYIFCYVFFLTLTHIKIKKFLSIILLISLYLSTYQISSYFSRGLNNYFYAKFYNYDHTNIFYQGSSSLFKTLKDSTINFYNENKKLIDQDNSDVLSSDTTRFLSLLIAKEKFQRSNIYLKLFGSGWYSSRETIRDVNNEFAERYAQKYKGLYQTHIKKTNVVPLQGIVAILLDTGIFGLVITLMLFSMTLKNILFQRSDLIIRMFTLSLLFIHFLCLFIGYPLNNIIYVLLFLPGGLFNYTCEKN